MTDQLMDLVDKFIEAWLIFDLQLREKQGLNETLLAEQIALLKKIKLGFEGEASIPKKLAEIFLDMWGAMASCAVIYEGDMPEKITMAADHLTHYARDICTS